MRVLAVLAVLALALTPAVAADQPTFRVPLNGGISFAAPPPVVNPPEPEPPAEPIFGDVTPPDISTPFQAQADLTRPTAFMALGLNGADFLNGIGGVINVLYDRSVTVSAAKWPPEAAPGSQQFTLVWPAPVLADGCFAVFNSRGTPTLSAVRFQYQDANGVWSDWSEPFGGWNTAVSGNKTVDGRCGLPEGGTLIQALRIAPTDHAGEVWYREFRASLYGVSAP